MKTRAFWIGYLILILAAPAWAQETTPPPAPAEPQKSRPFADVPDEYFKEADNFFHSCMDQATMNQYYNCDCLSLRYLDTRIKNPEESPGGIMQSIRTECVDATQAAGTAYERCLGNAPLLPLNIKPEEYCKCFASTYAKSFEKYKTGVTSRAIVELQTQAYVSCTNPALARRLYPYRAPNE